jgi:hypothetical protein
MAAPRYRLQRAAVILGGIVLGLVLTLAVAYLYVNHVKNRQYEEALSARLGLPPEYFSVDRVREDGTVLGTLRDVVLLDRQGDTVATVPTVALQLDTRSLSRKGPIVFPSMELRRPFLRLVQFPNGEWNATRIFRIEAGGKPVQTASASGEPDRPYLIRNLRIVDGRALVAMPAAPRPAGARFASARGPDQTRFRGTTFDVRRITGMQALFPRLLIGPDQAMRLDMASFRADVSSPDVAIRQMAGWLETKNGKDYRFAVSTLQTQRSTFDAGGAFRLADRGMTYDLQVRAHPLDLRDLGGLGFQVPSSGTARFSAAIKSLTGGRTRIAVTDAAVDVLGSHAGGRLTAVLSPNAPAVFTDTRLELSPLRISTLEQLGLVKETGFAGEVRGTVASVDAIRGGSGALRLDLTASVVPSRTPGAEPSLLAINGDVAVGGKDPFRLEGVRVEARPLLLSTFASMMPAQADLLKGAVRGSVLVSGTPAHLRLSDGELAYTVGDAPPTRLAGLSGTVSTDPALAYDLRATAQPLALATLSALYPALPFRSATLSGPVHLVGSAERVTLDAGLHGAAGGIDLHALVGLGGKVPTFDFIASLNAFRAGDVLTAQAAPEVPLSGTVAARGTTEDFRFDVNLLQGGGSLALHGGVRRPGGASPQFDVAGRADNFRIGVLVGQPNLLAGPVTGPLAFSGGGRQPITFNVDLLGPLGVLDVHGWYQAGTVPSYKVAGNVVGLDVSGLPGMSAFPGTKLTTTLDVEGRGITPETFQGRLAFDVAAGSTVGGVPVEAAMGRLTAANGQLRVDTLVLALRGARAEATGVLGLTQPSAEGLAFSLRAADLALLAGLFARAGAEIPRVEGSLSASGRVMGTLAAPRVIAKGTGAGLRYGENRAATFALDVDLARTGTDWIGRASIDGTDVLAMGQSLASVQLRVSAAPGLVRFGLGARRDAETTIAAGGTLEMDGTVPRAAVLDTLTLNLAHQTWNLQRQARLAFSAEQGVEVRDLSLARADGAGTITANGTLPPRGNADFTLSIRALDLAELHRLVPMVPALTGTLSMDATVRGPVGAPVMDVQAWLLGLTYGQARADSIYLRALTDATGMNVNAQARVAGRTLLTAEGRLPVTLSLGGIVPGVEVHHDAPVNVRVAADSLPVALVAGYMAAVKDPEGVIRGGLTLTGTPNHPVLAGGATIAGGAVTVDAAGARYTGINGSVRLAGRMVAVDSLVARSGGGWARLFGTADVTDGQHPTLDLTLLMDGFQVIDKRRVATLSASTERAPVRVTGTFPNATVSGDVLLDDGTVWIPDTRTAPAVDVVDVDVGQLGADTVPVPVNPAAALLAQLNAQNLHVSLGDDVWIEGTDAHIQITGDVDIDRAGGATRVTGDLEARRGTYTFRYGPVARDFVVERGRVRFYGTPELNPALDIVASHTVRPLDASSSPIKILITVGGTLQNPSIALGSETRPPLGETELLSLLVFGRRTNDLGALPGQLASDLIFQEALGGLLSSFEQKITRTGIFDFVRITTSSSFSGVSDPRGLLGSPSLELGKQLSDRWFVTLQVSNIFGNSATAAQALGIAVEGQLTSNLTLRTAYEPVRRDPLLQSLGRIDYQFSTDLRRRWEYGRPRNRAAVPAPTAADTLRPAVVPAGSTSPAPPPPAPPPQPRDEAPAPAPAPAGEKGAKAAKARDGEGAPR